MVSVLGEMCRKREKDEIWDIICQGRENPILWSCFRNLFASTCVVTVSRAEFCLSNILLVF